MDAREFEMDDPLPQTCQHCKHELRVEGRNYCAQENRVAEWWALTKWVPDAAKLPIAKGTCKHWEERE